MKKLDLTNYFKYNGVTRTNKVIDEIKRTTEHKINCSLYKDNIKPEELVVEIYNNTLPFSIGCITNKKLIN